MNSLIILLCTGFFSFGIILLVFGVMGLADRVISVGDQFGSWTIIDEGPLKGRNKYYLCRCVCGKEKLVQSGALRNGRSRSCGCSRHVYIVPDGYVGKTLGFWTVLEEVEKDGEFFYRCRCVCGTERLVKYKDMPKLPGRSCGCIREQRKKEAAELARARLTASEIGKTFGSWTVLALDETPRSSRQRYYLCRCVCGTERSVRRSSLLSGDSLSCGCVSGGRERRSAMQSATERSEALKLCPISTPSVSSFSLPLQSPEKAAKTKPCLTEPQFMAMN